MKDNKVQLYYRKQIIILLQTRHPPVSNFPSQFLSSFVLFLDPDWANTGVHRHNRRGLVTRHFLTPSPPNRNKNHFSCFIVEKGCLSVLPFGDLHWKDPYYLLLYLNCVYAVKSSKMLRASVLNRNIIKQ